MRWLDSQTFLDSFDRFTGNAVPHWQSRKLSCFARLLEQSGKPHDPYT